MTDVRDESGPSGWLILLFLAIAVLMAADVAADLRAAADLPHLAMELAVIVLAAAGAGALWRRAALARREARTLHADLHVARADVARWRGEAHEALRGLGAAIDRQFARWGLTDAERQVGLLLLKGLSHKEIAQQRDTSERTVRQQALAIYRKADLHSRAELAAFFLEDLLLPTPPAGPPDAA